MKKKPDLEKAKRLQVVEISEDSALKSSLNQMSLNELLELVHLILEIENLEKECPYDDSKRGEIKYLH